MLWTKNRWSVDNRCLSSSPKEMPNSAAMTQALIVLIVLDDEENNIYSQMLWCSALWDIFLVTSTYQYLT